MGTGARPSLYCIRGCGCWECGRMNKKMCLVWLAIIFICWILGAKISDINVAMIAIFYIGDCISDLAKAIEKRSEK